MAAIGHNTQCSDTFRIPCWPSAAYSLTSTRTSCHRECKTNAVVMSPILACGADIPVRHFCPAGREGSVKAPKRLTPRAQIALLQHVVGLGGRAEDLVGDGEQKWTQVVNRSACSLTAAPDPLIGPVPGPLLAACRPYPRVAAASSAATMRGCWELSDRIGRPVEIAWCMVCLDGVDHSGEVVRPDPFHAVSALGAAEI